MVCRVRLPTSLACVALGLLLGADAARAGEAASGDRIFFREPDARTRTRIRTLISRMPSSSVPDRRESRAELERIGYWSVDPLVEAVLEAEGPVRSSAILVLDAIFDPRALPALREVAVTQADQAYVGAFATLVLGRFRDGAAVPAYREALASNRSMDLQRAAAALAIARTRTPEALALLRERLQAPTANEMVRSARLLALGFFPAAALVEGTHRPGPELEQGLAARAQGERQAALIAYLVATMSRRDTAEFLRGVLDRETNPVVVMPALVGISRYADEATTELLARTAAAPGDDDVRELAADLLANRGDPVALPHLMKIMRTPQSLRLRAAAVLALSSIDHPDAAEVVLERLRDTSDLVRAAAAVGVTRLARAEWRAEGLERISVRLRSGGMSREGRESLELARSVLSGERTRVDFREVGAEVVFADLPLTWEQRLLRLVNLRAEASLDLEKIRNIHSDQELGVGDGPRPPDMHQPGGGADPGSAPPPEPGGSPSIPQGRTPPPAMGQSRTSAWQELRDLKVELRRRPYFTAEDLPRGEGVETR